MRPRDAVLELAGICAFHWALMFLIPLFVPIRYWWIVIFSNTIWIAERCWEVQKRTMGMWPHRIRSLFIASRKLILCLLYVETIWIICFICRVQYRTS